MGEQPIKQPSRFYAGYYSRSGHYDNGAWTHFEGFDRFYLGPRVRVSNHRAICQLTIGYRVLMSSVADRRCPVYRPLILLVLPEIHWIVVNIPKPIIGLLTGKTFNTKGPQMQWQKMAIDEGRSMTGRSVLFSYHVIHVNKCNYIPL